VSDAWDRDKLRFALTGEAGLNDGTAFPFVMLGLGLLGLHELGAAGWRWLAVDVVWASASGLAIGAALGSAVGRLVVYLRRTHQEAVGLDEFLALGLVGLSYGCAVLAHGYGFLAVFAAGIALRRLEQQAAAAAVGSDPAAADDPAVAEASAVHDATVGRAVADPSPGHAPADALATDPEHAPAFLAHALLGFNEKLERIGEMVVVTAIGTLLWAVEWSHLRWGFVLLLLLGIRPLAVSLGLLGSSTSTTQRALTGWFGIRGIGSLYYLMYAINHGLEEDLVAQLTALTLGTVVVSIGVHGVSVTPLMALYERSTGKSSAP
jgi:NhaP-type Na+/H+ or K+/H+ antiporter